MPKHKTRPHPKGRIKNDNSLRRFPQQTTTTTTGFDKTNRRRFSTQFSTKFSATFSESAMREHSSPSRMLHDSARLTTESKIRSFAAIPKRKRKQQKRSLVKRSSSSSSSITEKHSRYSMLPCTYLHLPGTWFYAGHRYLPTYLHTYLPSSVANLLGHNFRN